MPPRGRRPSAYVNVYLVVGASAYRVAFHIARRMPMICARKTKHTEVLLDLTKRRARAVVKLALAKLPLKVN